VDDPNEKNDLSGSEPERVATMQTLLLDLLNKGRSRSV